MYFFSWSGVSPNNSQLRLALTKNGLEIAFSWSEINGYESGSNSVISYLNRGDRIQLKVSEGQLYEPTQSYRGYTTLSGFKLSG